MNDKHHVLSLGSRPSERNTLGDGSGMMISDTLRPL